MPQLMEVLEFFDETGDTMVARVPPGGDCEIKWGAQLTVRESQAAVFFRDGRALVTFLPGRHVLKTQNIPVLTKLVTRFGYGADSPFRAEVYFVNQKLFAGLKWGTPAPIPFRDSELQMIRLGAFGIYSIRIDKPALFVNRIVGTQGLYRNEDIEEYLRGLIVGRLVDLFGEIVESVFDLPSHYDDLGAGAKAKLGPEFTAAGLGLVDFVVNAITPPPGVEAMIDERSGMAAVGDMNKFMQYKAAKALQDAAQQSGGGAGMGMGLGAGVGMGMMMPGMINQAFRQVQGQPSAPGGAPTAVSPTAAATAAPEADPLARIKQLKELLDMGAITQQEFDAKKADLLTKI